MTEVWGDSEGNGPRVSRDLRDLDDRALLALHVDGHPEAFGEIARRHRDRLWSVALRTLGDPEEAADAVQDGLMSAYRAAAGYRGDAAVTTWLHRIVVNASLDRARRRSARITVHLPDEGDVERERTSVVPDELEQREIALEVSRALAELPYEQAAAVVLVDVEGFSVEEVAEILQCPPGTVKSRCSRGRVKLATSLAHLRNRSGHTVVSAEADGTQAASESAADHSDDADSGTQGGAS